MINGQTDGRHIQLAHKLSWLLYQNDRPFKYKLVIRWKWNSCKKTGHSWHIYKWIQKIQMGKMTIIAMPSQPSIPFSLSFTLKGPFWPLFGHKWPKMKTALFASHPDRAIQWDGQEHPGDLFCKLLWFCLAKMPHFGGWGQNAFLETIKMA